MTKIIGIEIPSSSSSSSPLDEIIESETPTFEFDKVVVDVEIDVGVVVEVIVESFVVVVVVVVGNFVQFGKTPTELQHSDGHDDKQLLSSVELVCTSQRFGTIERGYGIPTS